MRMRMSKESAHVSVIIQGNSWRFYRNMLERGHIGLIKLAGL